jgi:DMSO/TMAO reductase YedYZ molybdopterin-dependent catalytic subunit
MPTGSESSGVSDARRSVVPAVLPAAAGVASAVGAAGIGELSAAVVAPAGSPFSVVGSAAIDLAPGWAKDAAIALFGTADKVALLVGIAFVVVVLAAVAGIVEHRRPPRGRVFFGVAALLGVLAAVTRSGPGLLDPVPSVLAGVAGAILVTQLTRRLPEPGSRAAASGLSRRGFLAASGVATALGALAALGGTALQAGTRAATAVREALTLPTPATTAPPVPSGADFGLEGLSPIVTPNDRFYRIDTALAVPQIDPSNWSLRITGRVDTPVEITWSELLALPLEESVTTLMCVSNEVGGDLIGTARWLGYPLRSLLALAGVQAGADMVLSRSEDGFTASTPLEVLQDETRNAILAVGMNGEPLPPEHGFPVRMVVPGLYGYVSATKWVVELEVTRFADATAYWTDRGWGERGPIKISSRIDVPRDGNRLDAGEVVVAGVAWHQHTGIAGVEVQVDGEPWQPAELADEISADTWRQWRYRWPATSGAHTLRARATDATGEVQSAVVQGVLPDGATGYHEIAVQVG